MFRITQYMKEIRQPTPLAPRRSPPGPVVIWNLVRRCNLACKHCYTTSADVDFPGELTTAQVNATMDDLRAFGVPVLILSGGEPLIRPDIFDISRRAKALSFYVGLSSNGTLIDDRTADEIAGIGYDYVGISLDGIGATHDRFRRKQGSFDAALAGIRLCQARGLKVGIRFTPTLDNAHELPSLLRLMDEEGISKFYLSHLNYGGRGNRNRRADVAHQAARQAMDLLFDACWGYLDRGDEREFVTGNNDADGPYFLAWARARFPGSAAHLQAKLEQWGGNASGIGIANIDNLGNVHPDTFWWHHTLGNVKERPFSAIWSDLSDPLLAGLRRKPRKVGGRCAACAHFAICGGNTRVRAHQVTGDPWAEDPGCYLTDEEIGIAAAAPSAHAAPAPAPALAPAPAPTPGPTPGPPSKRAPMRAALLALAAVSSLAAEPAALAADAPALYQQHCAACHGSDRLGGIGPALLPENLGRLGKPQAAKVILDGRAATQMPGFKDSLGPEQAQALADLVYAPLASVPAWGEAEIRASRVPIDPPPADAQPAHDADPLNLFVVVETGDHHVTILDGDKLAPIHRFASRFALHGGPKFSPDGRYVTFGSRDGWVTKFDLRSLKPVAEIRAGINTRNIAISADGRWLAVANYLPHTLVILDAEDLAPVRILEVKDRAGGRSSRVSAVYQARPRGSFVAALKDIPEIWEIATKGAARPEAGGLFAPRRITVDSPLDDFFFDPEYRQLVGSSRDGGPAVVVDMDAGRPVATVAIPGLPHLGSGITWERDGRRVMATPNLKQGTLAVVDIADWRVLKEIPTLGPGFFLRSHERSRYAWADNFMSPQRDTMLVIDKQTLEVAQSLRPAPGKTAAHVEFTRDGRYALVSLWEMDGALVVYDARSLAEVKRIPMKKPSGKYNVYNKITFSEGTSH